MVGVDVEKEKDREGGDWYVGQLVVYRGKEREGVGGGGGLVVRVRVRVGEGWGRERTI